ncbi:hypothetical protein SSX86_028885 [Deinandra increscens subsp. villosa]|uniref:Uncharacterized protein n=1 Tax=Deinandra increscens subsp. villosa TaxID=3103831 RepID=A0AAP0GKW9_9ASTR
MKAFMGLGSKPKEDKCPAFTNCTIKVQSKNSWQDTVDTLVKSFEGVAAFRTDGDKINISGYLHPPQLLKNLKKVGKKAEIQNWQYGQCSNNLFEKKEPPPANDNENGAAAAGGYPLYPRYPNVYGNGYGNGYPNAYGNGYGNGYPNGYANGYENGYGYCYNNSFPRIERNYGYSHLECSGTAQECNAHHMEQPVKSEKSYSSIPKKITGSKKNPMSGKNVPKCCTLM